MCRSTLLPSVKSRKKSRVYGQSINLQLGCSYTECYHLTLNSNLRKTMRHLVGLCSKNLHNSEFASSDFLSEDWALLPGSQKTWLCWDTIMLLTVYATERGQKLQGLLWLLEPPRLCCFFKLLKWSLTPDAVLGCHLTLLVYYKPAHHYSDALCTAKTCFSKAPFFSSSLLQILLFCKYWNNL